MDLITTHVNADFDGLSSLVAAKKLYPNSRLLLPGSPERAVREFLSLTKDLIKIESEKECELGDIERLILVDTRHKHRIGRAAQLIDRGVEVHIYDHHPRMKGDIVAGKDVYEEVGATVTILTDLIKRDRIGFSPLEATLALLGIYEETGSLTYRTTTKLDVDMVSYLLSRGANLCVVSNYLNRQLTEGELSILTKLLNSTERILINGVTISFIEIAASEYIDELGLLIHKLMEIENIPVLFVLINNRVGRVDIIARSAIANVDVNRILAHFGGGGHPSAAAAKVRTADAKALKNELVKVLRSKIKAKVRAKDIMSKNIKTVGFNERIDETRRMLARARMSGAPVTDGDRLAGIITLGDLAKAVRRGFGHSRIKGYMSGRAPTVAPNTPLHAIQKIISETDSGIIPVVSKGRLVGVVNRGDVLKNICGGIFSKPQAIKRKIVLNLSDKMRSVLPRDIMSLLRRIGALANSLGYGAFIVGGLVRDLILDVKNLDLDIVIEGDAIEFGKILSKELPGALIIHRRFGTSTVVTKARLKIDLVTARKEVYEHPAALPTVESSSLKNDLMRRDFTINAMAVSLNKNNFGQLVDYFGGRDALERGVIKVMHDGSFIDDPTRIFRAVRFEQRFSFRIDPHTEDLIRNAVKREMFDNLQPERIRDEVILILKEREPISELARMAELHELRFIHPKIRWDKEAVRFYRAIDDACAWYEKARFKRRPLEKWLMYLAVLFERLSYKETRAIAARFVFRRGERIRLLSYKRDGRRAINILKRRCALRPSEIYKLLEPLSYEVILLVMAKVDSKLARSRIADFLERYNGMRIKLRGSDLKALGLKPGPNFKRIMERVLYKKIDGALKTKKDELEYARALAKKI